MELDIRLPIGLMFSCLGPLLVATGLLTQTPLNTQTGSAMVVFGAVMLLLGVRAQRARDVAASDGSGSGTAARGGR